MKVNLDKMLEMQKVLDDRIIKEKGLDGQDLFPNTVLALQVELGEFANEGRWFKHWSDKQLPKDGTKAFINCPKCSGNGFWFSGNRILCSNCNQTGKVINPLLEEFVDSVHFFLSLANQRGWQDALYLHIEQLEREGDFDGGLTGAFLEMTYFLNKCYFENPNAEKSKKWEETFGYPQKQYWFRLAWVLFLDIGINGFGFTLDQIEEAYMQKNAVNHKRQDGGY